MYLYVDIESFAGNDKPSVESLISKAPKNYTKPETIQKWAEENADDMWRKQALDSMKGEVIIIGWAFDDEPAQCIAQNKSWNEQAIIEDFARVIESRMMKYGNMRPIWVGHNARAFDTPWLWRKALKYRCYDLVQRIPRGRYDKDVEDTMEMWATDNKDHVSLKDIAAFLGVGDKGGIDGGMVHDLWVNGETDRLREYCANDVELTRKVHRVITGLDNVMQMDAVNF